MAYTPYTVEGFGGLNFTSDSEEVGAGGAIDLLNIDFRHPGKISNRDGYASMKTISITGTATPATNPAHLGVVQPGQFLLQYTDPSGPTQKAFVFDTSGTTITSTTLAYTVGQTDSIIWSDPTNGDVGYFIGGATNTLQKFQGVFSTPSSAPTGISRLERTPWGDNRLVTLSLAGKVSFSGAGTPEVFGADDFVDLNLGAAYDIAAFDRRLFVLCARGIAVFYGTSVDSTGGAIFNYSVIPVADRISVDAKRSCVGPDGVYFVSYGGIYVTNGGGQPVKISAPIDALFHALGGSTNVPAPNITGTVNWQLAYADDKLYAAYTTGADTTVRGMLVWNRSVNQWSFWSLPAKTASCPMVAGTVESTVSPTLFFAVGETNQIRVFSQQAGLFTDDGTFLSYVYQSGWYDLGSPERKVIRESLLWGAGTPTCGLLVDYATSDSLAAGVALGSTAVSPPTIIEGRQRIARRGVFFSHKLSGTGGLVVSRLTHHLTSSYRPGAKPS